MRYFKDNMGREWTLALTIADARRVRDLLGVNLLAPQEPMTSDPPSPHPLVTRLHVDVMLLVDVIFALVKPQADEQNVTDVQWAAAMDGEAIYAAYVGFVGEWQCFFLSLHLPDLAKMVETHRAMVEAEAVKNEAMIDQAAEAVTRQIDQRRKKAIKKLTDLGPGKTSLSLPESSG